MIKFLASATLIVAALGQAVVAEAQTVGSAQALSGTRLEISVRGEIKRVPDVAVISTGVITQAANATTALSNNSVRMVRVLAALKKAGVANKDVTTSSINLTPQYRYNNNQPPVITGYQASNQVSVRFRDVARSGAILDALVKEGSNEISGPNLMIDNPEAAQDEARIAAIKQAKARAELYAVATGMKVKRIVSISEGEPVSGGPLPIMAMKASRESADTPIMPGEQNITMTVLVVFELQ